jgi:hypothetical protein
MRLRLTPDLNPSLAFTMHEGVGKVSPKSGQKSPMNSAAIASDLTKAAALALVEHAERRTGSRMTAYADVAKSVGASTESFRKYVNCSETKEPKWSVGWNLLDQFNQLCASIEQDTEAKRNQTRAIKREIDAIVSPVIRMVEGAPRTQMGATNTRTTEK